MKKKSLWNIAKVIIPFFIILHFLFAIILLATGEFKLEFELDTLLRTTLILTTNALVLSIAYLLYTILKKRNVRISKVEMDEFDRILLCNRGYYMLPAVGLLIVVLFIILIFPNQNKLLEFYRQGKITNFQLICPVAFGLISVISMFYMSNTKIFYSSKDVKIMRFLRKSISFQWSEVQTVVYQKKRIKSKGGAWEHITIVTETGKHLIREDIFQDGWNDFSKEALNQVKSRQIHLSVIKRKK